jgi:hypothetical protein
MHDAAARSLRTAERFLLTPPLSATLDGTPVSLSDISSKGARFRHEQPFQPGHKGNLRLAVESGLPPLSLEAVIIWSHGEGQSKWISGVRTYGRNDAIDAVLGRLLDSRRAARIEELRASDRFFLTPPLEGEFGGESVRIENLSARGAGIELQGEPRLGASETLSFVVPHSPITVSIRGDVVWTRLKSVREANERVWRAGLLVNEKPELMRLAIGQLSELGGAALDTHSLRLKLKILRARARQMAPAYREIEQAGIPAEQYLLIQGVREELRMNPDEAMYYYRRARLIINDPATRAVAPPIASHPDALAVWEYLDRSIDPSIVGRAFELPV